MRKSGAFSLLEVLISVVPLSIIGTVTLYALEEAQHGTESTLRYNQALGLATTLSEDIKDGYTNATPTYTIAIPLDALGGVNSGSREITIQKGTYQETNFQDLLDGFEYRISAKLVSSNLVYDIEVKDANGKVATVKILVNTL